MNRKLATNPLLTRRQTLGLTAVAGASLALAACDGTAASSLPDLSGHYECKTFEGTTYMAFDISTLDFDGEGVTFGMDHVYTGRHWKDGDLYRFEITGGASTVSDLLAKDRQDAYGITAEPTGEGDDLIVHIKAKSGYVYMGADSATFEKK